MADTKPLTTPEIVDALKDAGFVTKADVREIVGRSERRLKREMAKQTKELSRKLAKVATTSPTITQFNKLKARVDHYHPTS